MSFYSWVTPSAVERCSVLDNYAGKFRASTLTCARTDSSGRLCHPERSRGVFVLKLTDSGRLCHPEPAQPGINEHVSAKFASAAHEGCSVLDSCAGKFRASTLTCARFSTATLASFGLPPSLVLELTVATARVTPSAVEGQPL